MSYHILHLFEHGSYLYKKRGRLYCKDSSGKERSVPIENLRAIIVAAKGITFTSQLLSEIAENNCLVLHCCEKYKPVATTMPLSRIINQRILFTQTSTHGKFHASTWKHVLEAKIRNQSQVLDLILKGENPLLKMIAEVNFNEALAARMYFNRYFNAMDALEQNRSQRKEGWLNAFLNYGYAVLSALVHRSIVVHGLIPQLGINHKPRYGTWPLVYDLMEPLRPIVDAHVWAFLTKHELKGSLAPMEIFARFIGKSLKNFRVPHKQYKLKLVDCVDFLIRSYARACEEMNAENLWIPIITAELYREIIFEES